MEHRLHNVVYARLDAIKAAEKVTRFELGELSREVLIYVVETSDIDIVNRLIGVLTPMNKSAALAYFENFLPHMVERDLKKNFIRFGKQLKGREYKRRVAAIGAWLNDETNNLWTWAGDNLEVKVVEVDTGKSFSKALKDAINGVDTDRKHADPLPVAKIISMIAEEIDADTMLAVLMEMGAQNDHIIEAKAIAA